MSYLVTENNETTEMSFNEIYEWFDESSGYSVSLEEEAGIEYDENTNEYTQTLDEREYISLIRDWFIDVKNRVITFVDEETGEEIF